MKAAQSSRRGFLVRGVGAGLVGLASARAPFAGAEAAPAAAGEWRNWSGNQRARPAAIHYPESEAALRRLVAQATGPLRAFGGSHSFSALVPSAGTLVSVERLAGLLAHDSATLRATLAAGTRLAQAGELLAAAGQNLENEPDINLQSLAGATATATHGTGRTLQCLSGYVRGLRLVLPDGELVECSAARDAELFEAARVGLGALGVLSAVTLQNRAAYALRERTVVMDFDAACAHVEARRDSVRHVEFFVFPHGGTALVKEMELTDPGADPGPQVAAPTFDENVALEFAAEAVRRAPWLKRPIQRLVGLFVAGGERSGPAHRIFPGQRTVAFNEMEYTVAAGHGIECLREVVATIRARDLGVFFPVEFRYVAADDTWLGPCAGRAGAAISVHQYHRQDHRELFAAVEPVFHRFAGRPHWGKLHTLAAPALAALYPRWDDFLAVRRRADPRGRLLNPYLRTLFGVRA